DFTFHFRIQADRGEGSFGSAAKIRLKPNVFFVHFHDGRPWLGKGDLPATIVTTLPAGSARLFEKFDWVARKQSQHCAAQETLCKGQGIAVANFTHSFVDILRSSKNCPGNSEAL